jgi:hypothetical protein
MKKPLYTEGPWQVITADYETPHHGTHLGFAIVTQYPSISIGSIYLGNTDRIEPIRRANAQLMATAPELAQELLNSHKLISYLQNQLSGIKKSKTKRRVQNRLTSIERVYLKATNVSITKK